MPDSRLTLQSAAWAMTGFLDAASDLLQNDRAAAALRLYFYAATLSGWGELATGVGHWKAAVAGREVTAYIGTDHALTDPAALKAMLKADVTVRVLCRYNGVYHPKVLWFVEDGGGHLLVGSNNLTLDGLKSNIEFATLTRLAAPDPFLTNWHTAVHNASDPITPDLIKSYAEEREAFGKARAKANVAGSFTWSRRSSGGAPAAPRRSRPAGARTAAGARAPVSTGAPGGEAPRAGVAAGQGGAVAGDLVMEIMPRETGTGGSQVQIPMKAARSFFGLGAGTSAQIRVRLRNLATNDDRKLTMTRFSNATSRLVIRELDYRDRPCVALFRRTGSKAFDFELIQRAIDPDRYRALIRSCPQSPPKRRWSVAT